MTDELTKRMQVEKLEEIKRNPYLDSSWGIWKRQELVKKWQFRRLNRSGLKGETESLVKEAQDQVLKTKYYQKHILKQDVHMQIVP